MRRLGKKPDKPAALIVFARAPVPGRCKTRLIPAYGATGAARLQRLLAAKALALAATSGLDAELWGAPDCGHAFFHASRRQRGLRLRRQRSGDLGRKMGHAINVRLREGHATALLIGTDCPALTVADLIAAVSALKTHDCVLQPATDGGFVLIGARRPVHTALRGVDWSSGRELAQTCQRMRRLGFSVALMPPRWDVDQSADVRRAKFLGLL